MSAFSAVRLPGYSGGGARGSVPTEDRHKVLAFTVADRPLGVLVRRRPRRVRVERAPEGGSHLLVRRSDRFLAAPAGNGAGRAFDRHVDASTHDRNGMHGGCRYMQRPQSAN